ncbi:uncharacterized protein [Coffea arabica]|uniref:Uncharacterized protein isoform X1 n=1 Tax=Coffea arabica TaxID=13443 RepID=A0ABM4WA37_COFAR
MEVVTLNCCWKSRPYNLSASVFQPLGMEFVGPRNSAEMSPARFFSGFRVGLRVFASRNSVKKSRKKEKSQKYDTSPSNKAVLEENDAVSNTPPLADNYIQENSNTSSFNHSEGQSTLLIPSRGAVLRACTITSCLIGTLGVVIRQVSHFASTKGWPVIDASSEISLNFETWHLELIVGLVILISSCRYLLLNIWLDFAESSEAANKQVLSSLEPSDYIVVAFLPGISEDDIMIFNTSIARAGTSVSWCITAPFWHGLEECLCGCCFIWDTAFGKWSEVFFCCLGNVCRACLRLCHSCVLKYHRANGFSCNEQFSWWHHGAIHIKVIKIDLAQGAGMRQFVSLYLLSGLNLLWYI